MRVNDMLERGLIRPSNSPWSSPIVLAPKDTTYRFFVYFRRVNAVTCKDAHPMPRLDEILDQRKGAKLFTILDLASGLLAITTTRGRLSVFSQKIFSRTHPLRVQCHAL